MYIGCEFYVFEMVNVILIQVKFVIKKCDVGRLNINNIIIKNMVLLQCEMEIIGFVDLMIEKDFSFLQVEFLQLEFVLLFI